MELGTRDQTNHPKSATKHNFQLKYNPYYQPRSDLADVSCPHWTRTSRLYTIARCPHGQIIVYVHVSSCDWPWGRGVSSCSCHVTPYDSVSRLAIQYAAGLSLSFFVGQYVVPFHSKPHNFYYCPHLKCFVVLTLSHMQKKTVDSGLGCTRRVAWN